MTQKFSWGKSLDRWCITLSRWVLNGYRWLYGKNYDHLPYNSSKDGYSAFNALAGFAVAQGVALTAVAKGERHDLLVIIIYLVAVIVTIIWNGAMLRALRVEPSGSPLGTVTMRAFDGPSIRYGRWTLSWTVLVGFTMIYLGCNQLLPNQTRRVAYLISNVECDPYLIQNRGQGTLGSVGGSAVDRQAMDIWIRWITNESPVQGQNTSKTIDKRLIWIEQKTEFKEYYKSFATELVYDKKRFRIGDRVAFLVMREAGSARPVYRQLSFRLDNEGGFTDSFEMSDPNAGESLIIMCYVLPAEKGGDVPADTRQYQIDVRLTK